MNKTTSLNSIRADCSFGLLCKKKYFSPTGPNEEF